MHREIITSNGCLVGNDFEILIQKGIIEETKDSKTHKKWNELLDKSGLYDPDSNVEAKDLFALLKQVFDLKYCQTKDICFRTGYVFSVDFERSIKHIDSSRAYSTANTIYIDELLVSVLFEYLAVYYLWAAKKEEPDVYAFCFQKSLYLLEGCYRKGNLDNDESKSEIIDMISKHCKSNAAVVISDLYWCSLAFAMSHELAHIYHGHNRFLCENKQDEWAIEYAADKNGYEVILELISKKYLGVPSPFHEVFENYAYTAPEILLLFYEDLFYVGQWLHGELPGDTHPDFKSRIDKLLEQSNSSDYTFDTEDGNAVLSSYWEISDLFREELLLKLVHGKLEIIKRKGENTTMSGNGYEEAYAFDEAMCNVVRQIAQKEQVPEENAVGLWNLAIQIDVPGNAACHSLVCTVGNKVFSTKAINVFFNQKNALEAIVSMGISIKLPQDRLATIRFLMLILFNLYKITTVDLSKDMARILIECHNRNAYINGINEEELLAASNADMNALSMLEKLRCVKTIDNRVFLNERVLINNLKDF